MNPRLEANSLERRAAEKRDLLGAQVGPYRVVGFLGAGGMGEVYEVEHERLGRRFAMKTLRPELSTDRETLTRFHRESRAVAQLLSEHVVSIVDVGALEDETPYFVMERLYGTDLRRLLNQEGVLPVARVAHLGVDACRGLACAHTAGLVHRDLKPENLFLTSRDDGQDLLKLLDFGVVKSAHDNTTRPGAMIGTTRYMAPEQLGLEVPVSPQTDLFALGVILYECLAGQSPFQGDTIERVLFKIMSERETPLRELRPEVPDAFATLLSRALSKNPSDRPESALAFAEALLPFTLGGNGAFSTWQLRVWDGPASGSTATELTAPEHGGLPREAAAESASSAAVDNIPRHRTYGVAAGSLVLGLGLGVLATWQLARKPAPDDAQAAPTAPRVLPTAATAREAPARLAAAEASSALSAGANAPPNQPAASAAPVADRGDHGAKNKPIRVPSTAKSPAPLASYDPRNPYAP